MENFEEAYRKFLEHFIHNKTMIVQKLKSFDKKSLVTKSFDFENIRN
jgi:hypothetical protein